MAGKELGLETAERLFKFQRAFTVCEAFDDVYRNPKLEFEAQIKSESERTQTVEINHRFILGARRIMYSLWFDLAFDRSIDPESHKEKLTPNIGNRQLLNAIVSDGMLFTAERVSKVTDHPHGIPQRENWQNAITDLYQFDNDDFWGEKK